MNIVSSKIYHKIANYALEEGLSNGLLQKHKPVLNEYKSKNYKQENY